MRRAWYQLRSDGRYFRNCPLIMSEQRALLLMRRFSRKWRRQFDELQAEWQETFRCGVRFVDQIPDGDTVIPYDDSPEATARWVSRFTATGDR